MTKTRKRFKSRRRKSTRHVPEPELPDRLKEARKVFHLVMKHPWLAALLAYLCSFPFFCRSYSQHDGSTDWFDSLAFAVSGLAFSPTCYLVVFLSGVVAFAFWLGLRRRARWIFAFFAAFVFGFFPFVAALRGYAFLSCSRVAQQSLFTSIALAPNEKAAALELWSFQKRAASEFSETNLFLFRDRKNAPNLTLSIFFKDSGELVLTLSSLERLGFVEKKDAPVSTVEEAEHYSTTMQGSVYRVTPRGIAFYRCFLWSRNLGAPEWLIEPVLWHLPSQAMSDLLDPFPEYYHLSQFASSKNAARGVNVRK